MMARLTEEEIQNINNYEKQQKIKTTLNKFHVININRQKEGARPESPPRQRRNTIRTTSEQTWIYQLHRIPEQRPEKKASNTTDLGISGQPIRKIYLASIRPTLLYPLTRFMLYQKLKFKKLQTTQNKAAYLIKGAKKNDRYPIRDLHDLADIEPINIYLEKSAAALWRRINRNIEEDIVNKSARKKRYRPNLKLQFPSSRQNRQQRSSKIHYN